MNYLITESKLNETIKGFILESFSVVQKVEFTRKKIVLGSTGGFPVVEQTLIRILINNSNNKYNLTNLKQISKEMRNTIDGMFGFNSYEYGSEYDYEFQQLATVSLEATLKRNPIK